MLQNQPDFASGNKASLCIACCEEAFCVLVRKHKGPGQESQPDRLPGRYHRAGWHPGLAQPLRDGTPVWSNYKSAPLYCIPNAMP